MTGEPIALRPPVWADKYRWHWLAAGDHTSILQWRAGTWRLWDYSKEFSPDELAVHGWRYIGPADPSARVIDQESEAMVECVIDMLTFFYEADHDDYKTVAKAVITALKEMP